jgi:hypothetical protein
MTDQIVVRSQTCSQWATVAETMALFSWANFLDAELCVRAAIAMSRAHREAPVELASQDVVRGHELGSVRHNHEETDGF